MIPQKISIGQVDYTVHLFPDTHYNTYGVCLTDHQRIYLSVNQGWQQAGNTLLHEVMHAIWHQSGLNCIDTPTEENIVNIGATWIQMVLAENPDLTEFIVNTEKHWNYTAKSNPDEEALNTDD
jgi:hypothetical protein